MKRIRVATGSLMLALLAVTGAGAQSSRSTPAPRSNIPTDEDAKPNVPPPVPTLPPSRGIAGPRLEPGAVLCNTQADLEHRAQVTQRISDGVPDAGEPLAGCRIIAQERGVDVLSRAGLGRSEVRVKPSGQVGWTDAYLH